VLAARLPRRSTRTLAAVIAVLLVASLQAVSGLRAENVGAPVEGLQQTYTGQRITAGSQGVPASTPASFDGEHLAVQAVDVGRRAAEPTIGVDAEGNAFFAAGDFDGPAGLARTEVLRSTDDGLTWESVQPRIPGTQRTTPPTTLDPYVYVDEDTGRVFNPELYLGCTYMSFSDDKGESWLTNPVACGDFVNDHQTVWTGPPPARLAPLMQLYPNVLYYCFNRVVDANCGRSLDGGLTFTPTAGIAFPGFDPAAGGLCGGLHGHIKVDHEGRLYLPKGHCGNPWLAVSEDGGDTWTRTRVSTRVNSQDVHTAVDVDDAGNVYYTWFDRERRLPYLAVSTDHGRTFGDPIMIAPPGVHEVNFPVLTAGAEGRIAIMFPGSTVNDRANKSRPWNSYHVVTTNALDEQPLFLSITANPVNDPIHRGDCSGRCAGMFDFLDIVTSPASGEFWSAITDTCTERSNCVEGGTGASGSGRGVAVDAVGLAVRQIGGPLLRPDLVATPVTEMAP
jgi:hypothetical protein